MKIVKTKVRGATRWKLDCMRKGVRYRRFCHTRDEAEVLATALSVSDRAEFEAWASATPLEIRHVIALVACAKQAGIPVTSLKLPEAGVQCPSLGEAIEECINSKVDGNRRKYYIGHLRQVLLDFAKGIESLPLSAVSVDRIRSFVQRPTGLQSRRTYYQRVNVLFNFAVRRGWLLRNPANLVELPIAEIECPTVLSVREASKALVWTLEHHPRALAWLSLALFAGLRPNEVARIDWDAVRLTEAIVVLDAAASKVRQRRIVPLDPPCAAWLGIARQCGAQLPYAADKQIRARRKFARSGRPRNWSAGTLRHTAASMWMAMHADAAKVSTWLGNSPRVLFSNYREIVRPADAKRFFNLTPNLSRPWIIRAIEHAKQTQKH